MNNIRYLKISCAIYYVCIYMYIFCLVFVKNLLIITRVNVPIHRD